MYINMTGIAVNRSLCKDESWMAKPAFSFGVLSGKGKFSLVMIVRIDILIDMPPFFTVTGTAAHFKIVAVRMIRLPEQQKLKDPN
jgi:hypothetical protein